MLHCAILPNRSDNVRRVVAANVGKLFSLLLDSSESLESLSRSLPFSLYFRFSPSILIFVRYWRESKIILFNFLAIPNFLSVCNVYQFHLINFFILAECFLFSCIWIGLGRIFHTNIFQWWCTNIFWWSSNNCMFGGCVVGGFIESMISGQMNAFTWWLFGTWTFPL